MWPIIAGFFFFSLSDGIWEIFEFEGFGGVEIWRGFQKGRKIWVYRGMEVSRTVKDGVDGYRDLWGWGIGILEVGTRKGTLLCRGRICNFFLLSI